MPMDFSMNTSQNIDDIVEPLLRKYKKDNQELSKENERLKMEIEIRKEMFEKLVDRIAEKTKLI